MLGRIDQTHLPGIRAARAAAQEPEWVAGASPDLTVPIDIDFDAMVTISHSGDKETVAKNWNQYGTSRP